VSAVSAVSALRRQLRRFAWIALTAMLALAVVPTLSRALAFADLAEICTQQGPRTVAVSGEQAPAPDGGAFGGHFDHCPLCSLHGAAPILPPEPQQAVLRSDLAEALPPLYLLAPHTLHAWSAAQPRAPPASC
jgi:hypothetical protein